MAYERTTEDLPTLQGHWGQHGWEYISAYKTMKEARAEATTYRQNDKTGSFRVVTRRYPLKS